jgi:HAE1 family hydrophobic/amphiphilic exporter-1
VSPAGGFSTFPVRRPVAVLMLFAAAIVFGLASYGRLPINLMPELNYPTLTVRTEYPGAAPEEVENDISRPIEEALGVIGGLTRISSISRAGVSDVILEFQWDTPSADATQDTLEKLDLVFLPQEAERPLILHYDPNLDPVMELSLSGAGQRFAGEQGLRRLRRLADLQVKRALEPIKGVAAVRVRGGLEEEIHVLLDEEALRRTGIAIQTVIDRLRQENINVAGGNVTEGRTEYMVRTLNEFEDPAEITEVVVATFEGRDVRVRDLGRVVRSHKEREILTRTDGGDSVQIDIYREGDANIVALAHRVKEAVGRVPEAEGAAPAEGRGGPAGRGGRGAGALAERLFREEGAKLQVVADRSLFIESSLKEVRNTTLLGGLLAVIVLFPFLRSLKTTLIIAVSIPISLFITFAPLNLMGVTLNIMTLGGLALGVGMLVDNSIVVLESIFRCREEGDDVLQGAVRGTAEVRGAVVASTLTTVAVFFPMVFVEGIAGQAFGDLGLAVVYSLLASLAVALFFIPMLASRQRLRLDALGPERRRLGGFATWRSLRESLARYRGWRRIAGAPYFAIRLLVGMPLEALGKIVLLLFLGIVALGRLLARALGYPLQILLALPLKVLDLAIRGVYRGYPRVLAGALRAPGLVGAATLAAFLLTWQIGRGLDSELLPEVHQGEFTIEVALPVGTPLEETDAILAPVEDAVLQERGAIESLLVTLGYDAANTTRSDEGEHTARFKVLLDPSHRDPASEEAVIARLRERFAAIPDVEARVSRPVLFSSRIPIEVEVHGDDLPRLRAYAERAQAVMASLPGLADVETTLRRGAPEVQVFYDRDLLARAGLNIGQVARLVRDKVQGYEATRFNLKDRRIPIVVRLGQDDRETVEDVRAVAVNPGGPHPIPLSAVATVDLGEGPSEVRRVDGKRVALVRANLASGSLGSAAAAIEEALRSRIEWPDNMTFLLAGQNEEWERSRTSLWLALGLSIFLVYVIMAAQFESLAHPFLILFTIPMAFFGSVVALRALGISLSIVVFLGMILLAGIVVNNAIVLVDYINTLRQRGRPLEEAIRTAASVRLRPILMTTLTTVLGLLPMAVGLGDGAEIRTPMAITVISGLSVSTALTLVVIPVCYLLLERMKLRLRGRREAEAGMAVEPGAAAESVAP